MYEGIRSAHNDKSPEANPLAVSREATAMMSMRPGTMFRIDSEMILVVIWVT